MISMTIFLATRAPTRVAKLAGTRFPYTVSGGTMHGETSDDVSVYLVCSFPLVVPYLTRSNLHWNPQRSQFLKLVLKTSIAESSNQRRKSSDNSGESGRGYARKLRVTMSSPNAPSRKETSMRFNCSRFSTVRSSQMTRIPYVAIEVSLKWNWNLFKVWAVG